MREAFEKEVKFMARLKHENVVRLLGVCLSSNAFIMMEYMESGDLNHYLRDKDLITAESYPLPDNAVTVPVLVYMCLQIARAKASKGHNESNNHVESKCHNESEHVESKDHNDVESKVKGDTRSSSTTPNSIKNKNAILVENALYSSADQLNNINAAVSNPPLNSTDFGGSAFNIYAEPNKVLPPPIPDFRASPSMYSIDLNPSHFRSQELLSQEDSSSLHPFSSVYADPLPILRSDVLEVTEQNISEIKELGVGQFGTVILASTIGLSLKDLGLGNVNTSVSILVAVKKLHYDADAYEREAFEKEIKFMSRLKHENVVHILGVCLNTNAFIMMEYMENGDLNQYIQKFEFSPDCETSETDKFINVGVLIYMSLQIASGMRYLASMNFVHRDLATRNCLVGQKFIVKIADFGMSRQLYDNSYYRIRGKAMLPIRWMAKECFYGRFSEKTDVWAFGVVMWEIFTLCKQQPYEHLSDQEVIDDAVQTTDSPVNGYSSLPMPVYSEAVDHPTANGSPIYNQAKTPDDIYSEPQWKKEQNPFEFNLDNPIYEDADNDQPFSFVQSDLYSEGLLDVLKEFYTVIRKCCLGSKPDERAHFNEIY
ncbi:class II receptor tyrosine kinase-like, partial [Gigantopelta aegis]|uniref:class II receptor tyrosine kinase-like n=1 Tax=Gigantopelta aegis TaxID=1735272 RepID=UPI001B88AC7B